MTALSARGPSRHTTHPSQNVAIGDEEFAFNGRHRHCLAPGARCHFSSSSVGQELCTKPPTTASAAAGGRGRPRESHTHIHGFHERGAGGARCLPIRGAPQVSSDSCSSRTPPAGLATQCVPHERSFHSAHVARWFCCAPRSFLSSSSRAGPSLSALRQQRTALRLDRSRPPSGVGGGPSGPRAQARSRTTPLAMSSAGSAPGAGQWSAESMADAESFLQATLGRASGTPPGAAQRTPLVSASSAGPTLPRLGPKAGIARPGVGSRAGSSGSPAGFANRGWDGHPQAAAAAAAAPPRPASSFTDDWRAVSPMEAAAGSGSGSRPGYPLHAPAPDRGARPGSSMGRGAGVGSRERVRSEGPDGFVGGHPMYRDAPPSSGVSSSRGSLGPPAPAAPHGGGGGGGAGPGPGGAEAGAGAGGRMAQGLRRAPSGTSDGPDGRFRESVRSSTMSGSAASLVRSTSRRGRAGGVGGALSANPLAGRAAPSGTAAGSRRRATSRTGTRRQGRGRGRGRARTRDTLLTAQRRPARDKFEGLSAFGEGLDEADYDYVPEARFRTRLVAAGLVRPDSGGASAGWEAGTGASGMGGGGYGDGGMDGGGPDDDGAGGGQPGASDRARAMDDLLSAVARGDEAARLRQQLHASRAAASHAAEAIRAGTLDLVGGPAGGGGGAGAGGFSRAAPAGAQHPDAETARYSPGHRPAGSASVVDATAMRFGPGGSAVPPLAIGGRAAAQRSSHGGQLPSLGLARQAPSRSISEADSGDHHHTAEVPIASRTALRPLTEPGPPGSEPSGRQAHTAPHAPADSAAQDRIASIEAEMAQDSGLASWASKLQGQVASSQSPSARGTSSRGSHTESDHEASPSRGVSKQLEAMRALRERLSRVAGVALP